MNIRRGDTLELRIEKMVYGGRALAYHNSVAVFVDKAVPGERVTARVIRVKRNFAQARLLEILEVSPHRAIAPCPYNDHCGGCKWQFIDYEKQLEYKHASVEDSLYHIGKVADVSIHPVLPSPQILGYRNKMEFSFSDRRWFLPTDKDCKTGDRHFALGLHVPGTFDKIIDLEGCLLQGERGNEILREVKRYVKGSELPVYGLKSHRGFWRYLVLRHSHCFDEWMVNLVTSEERSDALQPLIPILRDRFGEIASLVNNINTRRGGTAVGERERILAGRRGIRDKIGEFTFEISAHSFFQTNTAMAEKLYERVKNLASLTGKETVFDLYCGIGTVSLFLASAASRIFGMDISDSATGDANRNCQLNGVDNCEFLCGDVAVLLSQTSIHPDLLITDPPRAGMHKKVIDQINRLLPDRVIYISCNPSTLARDVALLKERYRVEEVQPLDLFPNTYHVESVARLERRS
jgi:23S rRNA (uracil1939-C5)-methyltransferase